MQRFSNILAVVDTDAGSSAALRRAVALAKENQALLTLVDVVEMTPAELRISDTVATPEELSDVAVSQKREALEELVATIAEEGVSAEATVLVGKPFMEIIRQVLRNKHDLLIKSTAEQDGIRKMLFTSTDMHLMRKCPCPVWITKATEHPHHRRILAAVDLDPEGEVKEVLNRLILELASSMALAAFCELHVVHVWRLEHESQLRSPRMGLERADVDAMVAAEESSRSRWLEDLVHNYGTNTDKAALDYLAPQLHLLEGNPQRVIPTLAGELDVDLIVMGTIARSGIPGFLMGNTAENVLNQIDCSVLAVKPEGFVSPVSL